MNINFLSAYFIYLQTDSMQALVYAAVFLIGFGLGGLVLGVLSKTLLRPLPSQPVSAFVPPPHQENQSDRARPQQAAAIVSHEIMENATLESVMWQNRYLAAQVKLLREELAQKQ